MTRFRPAAFAGVAAALCALLPALTACTGSSAARRAAPASATRVPDPSPPRGQSGTPTASAPRSTSFQPARLGWRGCGGGYQCATLPVPLDYADPAGPAVSLAVIRLPAGSPSRRIGTLFVNPGGPGNSGVDFVRNSVSVLSGPLRARFDVVSFDPRGVGASDGVRCGSDAALDRLVHDDPAPTTAAGRAAYLRDAAVETRPCRSGARARLVAHVGTVETARDIDTLRRALGERTLSYLGFSYGTYLGATWVDLFPRTVRAAVLDGALDPALDLVGILDGQAVGFEDELTRWFAWCDRTPAGCAFARGGSPSAGRYDALAARVHGHPVPAGARSVGPGEFGYAVAGALYGPSLWPVLGQALASGVGGDGRGLLALSDGYLDRAPSGHFTTSFDASTAITCLDHAGPQDEPGWYAAAQTVRAQAPRLGPGIVYQQTSCAVWPVPGRAARIPRGAGAPPVVVVGATHDPATPYVWARALARDLAGAVLVTRDGDGHTSYGRSGCVRAAVDGYLLDRHPPAKGLTCPSSS